MAPTFQYGDVVRVTGGQYSGSCGVVIRCTQDYVYVEHAESMLVEKSQARFCELVERAATDCDGLIDLPLRALISAVATVAGRAGVDLIEAVTIFQSFMVAAATAAAAGGADAPEEEE